MAKQIITPPATVLLAFIHRPMNFASELVYVAEIALPDRLGDLAESYREEQQFVYVVTSQMQPALFDKNGLPTSLSAEIGPGSLVRMVLRCEDSSLVMTAVSIIAHRIHNPFATVAA